MPLADITLPVWTIAALWLLLILFMALAYYHATLVIHLRRQLEAADSTRPAERDPKMKPVFLKGILS